MSPRLALFAACLVLGCDASAVSVVVQLRSDLVPGREVVTARASARGGGARLDDATSELVDGAPLLDGLRVAELSVPPGEVSLRVDLLDAAGAVVVGRDVLVEALGATVVTVVLTRSCRDVRCPDASALAATACLGGRCVTPECTPQTPESCPVSECARDAECPDGPGCATPVCFEGVCGLTASADGCAATERCDLDVGCVPRDADAGPPTLDAGTDGGGRLDAGPPLVDAGRRDAGDGAGCAAVCPGTCEKGVCVLRDLAAPTCPDGVPCRIDCGRGGSCTGPVTCGDGACVVDCAAPGSCGAMIDCARASDCDISCGGGGCDAVRCSDTRCSVDCLGSDSCDLITCGAGDNVIDCPGPGSCITIECSASTDARITCGGPRTCAGRLACGGTLCDIDCVFGDCGAIDCSAACQCDVSCTPSSCMPAAECPPTCRSGNGCRIGAAGCGC